MRLDPIAIIETPFRQKFAIPRQPNLVPEATGRIVFSRDFTDANLLRELEQFSHLWLLFWFHETASQGWTATVQPPRLGGKDRVGTLASRSPFRPNPIGMSAVSNLGYTATGGELLLKVGGVDLLDGTPILDIKPYIPYADSIPDASGGYASDAPASALPVSFDPAAERDLQRLQAAYPQLRGLVESVLSQDPRPAWRVKADDRKQYGMHLFDLNIKWRVLGDRTEVLSISAVSEGKTGE